MQQKKFSMSQFRQGIHIVVVTLPQEHQNSVKKIGRYREDKIQARFIQKTPLCQFYQASFNANLVQLT